MFTYYEDKQIAEDFFLKAQFSIALNHFKKKRRSAAFKKKDFGNYIYIEILSAKFLILRGEFKKAIDILSSYLNEEDKINTAEGSIDNFSFLEAELHHYLGVAHLEQGNYLESKYHLEYSLDIKLNTVFNCPDEIADTCLSLVNLSIIIRDFDLGLLYTQIALAHTSKELNKEKDYRKGRALLLLSEIYYHKNALSKAKNYIRQAKQVFVFKKHTYPRIFLLRIDGMVHWKEAKNGIKTLSKYEKALSFFGEAIKILDHIITDTEYQHYLKGVLQNKKGRVFTSLKNFKKALIQYNEATNILQDHLGTEHPYIGNNFIDIAYLNRQEHNYGLALNNLQQAIFSCVNGFSKLDATIPHRNPEVELKNIDSFKVVVSSTELKIGIFLRSYDLSLEDIPAEKYLDYSYRGIKFLYELLRKINTYFFRKNVKFPYTKYARNLCEFMLELCIKEKKLERKNKLEIFDLKRLAFEITEFARTVTLFEDFRESIRRQMEQKDTNFDGYIVLKEHLNIVKQQQNFNYDFDRDSIKKNAVKIIEQLKKFNQKIQFPSEGFWEKEKGIDYVNVEKVQSFMQDVEAGIVYFFWGTKSVYVFIIGKTFVELLCIASDKSILTPKLKHKSLTKDIDEFKKMLSIDDPEKFKEAVNCFFNIGYRLYLQLFKPYEYIIQNIKRLYIIPDRDIVGIPFETLIFNKECSKFDLANYLIKKNIIFGYHFSATILCKPYIMKLPTNSNFKLDLLAVAPVKFEKSHKDLKDLNNSKKAVNRISQLFNKEQRIKILDFNNATVEKYNENAESSRIIYFLTHISDSNKIHFYGKEILEIKDITQSSLNTELVFICGCSSANMKNDIDVISIERAFLAANSKNVICTLIDVRDAKPTHDLTFNYYKHLMESGEYSRALHNAKLTLIKSGGYSSLPIYWSPFIFIGDHTIQMIQGV